MKKVIILITIIVSSLIFNSCDNSDDSPEQDQLIGKWKISKVIVNGEEENLSKCADKKFLEFKFDGEYTVVDYKENANNDCVLEETINGIWINKGNNIYEFIVDTNIDTYSLTFENNTFSKTEEINLISIKIIYVRL